MKKLKDAIDKYLVHILFLVLLGIGTFIWDYASNFFSLPETTKNIQAKQKIQDSLNVIILAAPAKIEAIVKKQRAEDSTNAIIGKRVHRIDSILAEYKRYLDEDYERINKLEGK